MRQPKDLLHKAVGLIRVIVEALKKKSDQEMDLSRSEEGVPVDEAPCFASPTASPIKGSPLSPSKPPSLRKGSVYFDGLSKDKPCSGESFMLMYDRWKTLGSSFYKHGKFNASKIPDIYDSVKYDTLHNSHLGLPGFLELYSVAKRLADVVIPNEYGITPEGKYQIASKVVPALVGKILQDLANTREESLEVEGHKCEGEDLGEEDEEEQPTDELDVIQNRLYPEFALQINSPLRHVRTRVYFTSESHIHALANLLRYATLREPDDQKGPPIVSEKGGALMSTFSELDYVSHLVIRMFEKKDEPIDSPRRFRIMVLFSPGANSNPVNMSCIAAGSQPLSNRFVVSDHSQDSPGLTLDRLVKLLKSHATYRKPANKSKEWTIPMRNKTPREAS
jgi:inositol hexakisphosphate/diphosphoinositol-pentakisphosphate kinase